ncbi:OmpH family outer membrane protein [Candidatus Coxiella mudrowiae]|uniref:Outer membrane protein n=1 Tax=Candidatus Coxiella mudrowiae TaxID=2054173 RepID=A0ABM5UTV4_9COXI|nr:OmpH family outer membrane protein [Candidatus Coxiella mudrowiae]AKQ33372.1 Outer membrane protein [Candidatus Coxiella mudrowiae]AKQ33459.1 Outer membrane protein [Candidatus Coxiella mudrowiae]
MMKRLFAATCLSVAINWTAAAIGQTVGRVDMRQIFQASPQVKNINTQLEKKFSPQRERIINLGKSLQEDAKKFQRNEAVMSEKEKQDLKNKIDEKQKELQQAQVEFQQGLYNAQNKAMAEFMTKISGAVRAVAEKEKVDLVLPKDTVLYARDSKDITSDVISKLK